MPAANDPCAGCYRRTSVRCAICNNPVCLRCMREHDKIMDKEGAHDDFR